MQITAPISTGSSGGPLFNMEGKVIGITTAILTNGENLNFAVPINDVKSMQPMSVHVPTQYPLPDVIRSVSGRYHLDPDLVAVLIRDESRNGTVSYALLEKDVSHLRELLERYNFDLIRALAAYKCGTKDVDESVDQVYGIPLNHEIRAYVSQIVKEFNREKLHERYVQCLEEAHEGDTCNFILDGPISTPSQPNGVAH